MKYPLVYCCQAKKNDMVEFVFTDFVLCWETLLQVAFCDIVLEYEGKDIRVVIER